MLTGKTITVLVAVGVMLLVTLLLVTSGMPTWLMGRLLVGAALLLPLLPAIVLTIAGHGEWAKALGTAMIPFVVIGFILLVAGVVVQEAVPVSSRAYIPPGEVTEAYETAIKQRLEFRIYDHGNAAFREFGHADASVTNWKGPGEPPELMIFTPNGDHAPRSLPCVLIPKHTHDLLTREQVPKDHESMDWGPASANVANGFLMITYFSSGRPRDWRKDGVDKGDLKEAIKKFREAQGGLSDARVALELALSRPEVNPTQIYVGGAREAGLLALLLATHDDRIRGCIVSAPVTDIRTHYGQARLDEISRDLVDVSDFAIRNSPITHAERIRCPVLLIYPSAEKRVSKEQTTSFADRLRQLGKDVEFVDGSKENSVKNEVARTREWFIRLGAIAS